MTIYSDERGRYYAVIRVRGYRYPKKVRRGRKRVRRWVRVPGYSYLARVRLSEPPRKRRARRIRKVRARLPVRLPSDGFISFRSYWNFLKGKYEDIRDIDPVPSWVKWAKVSLDPAFFWYRRAMPSKSGRYITLTMWFILWDENEEHHRFWTRSRLLYPTLAEYRDALRGQSWEQVKREIVRMMKRWTDQFESNDYLELVKIAGWTVGMLAGGRQREPWGDDAPKRTRFLPGYWRDLPALPGL